MSRDVFARHPGLRRRIYRAAFTVGPLLPAVPALFLAYLGGLLAWACDARGRRTVEANLAPAFPPGCTAAIRRTARRCYVSFAWSLVEALQIPLLRPALARVAMIDPWRVAAQRPIPGAAIFTTIHANWELCAAAGTLSGIQQKVAAIALPHGDGEIDALFQRTRAAHGVQTLLLGGAPLASLRALRDGTSVCIVAERDYSAAGLPCRLLGRAASLPVGPASLAVQTGARIIPVMLARRGVGRFALVFGRSLRADPDRPKADEVRRLTNLLADTYSRFIRAVPGQWVAFHPLWPRQPR